MDPVVIEKYIERIYGFAVNNTYSRDEADDLAQEILFTAVCKLPSLRDESKFEPWLWGIAKNLTKRFRVKCEKRHAMYSYDMISGLSYEDVYFDEQEELYDALRTKIAMLSAQYREIVVLYYYDGLSTKAIAEKLNIPEGTVRWRLSEARKKIKEGGIEVNKKAVKTEELKLFMYGHGFYNGNPIPFPTTFINDALSRDIVYHCYEKTKGVEDLAKFCNVPARYIEDRIANLLEREAILEVSRGKYLTDFVIFSDKHRSYYEENAERLLMPMMDRLLHALQNIAKDASEIGFHKAGRSETDLFYLYGAMTFSYLMRTHCDLPNPPHTISYDGNRWRYIGDVGNDQCVLFKIWKGFDFNLTDRGCCAHISFGLFSGIAFRRIKNIEVIKICEDLLFDGKTKDVEAAAQVIKDGFVTKQPDGGFFVTVPYFTLEQKAAFDAVVEKHFLPLMPEYSEILRLFVAGYKKLFPSRLNDDADRLSRQTVFYFYATIIEYAQRIGVIPMPSTGCCCDAFVQFKKKFPIF